MKQLVLLTLIIIGYSSSSSFAQIDSNPKEFLKGHFEYCQIETQSTVHYKGRTMVEVINTENGEITIHSKVKWIDDNNYVLIATKVNGTNMPVGTKLYVSIIKINENQMVYKYKIEGGEEKVNCLLKLEN